MTFDDLHIDEEFKYKGRNFKKATMFGAYCLDRNSPFNPECIIAIERKEKVELKSLRADDPNSIFKRKTK